MYNFLKIGDLIENKKAHSQTGPFGTQLQASEYVEEGFPVINVRNIGLGDIKNGNLEYIDEKKAMELKSHSLLENDIVFGRKGAVERHSFVTTKEAGWIQGSDCIRLRFLTEEINPKFISYFFRTRKHQQWMINLGSFGATMGSLNQEIISKIEIPDISKELQDEIATILSYYDDLIEINNQKIKLLEETAEEIYKEWFVSFRFPGFENTKFFDKEGKEVKHDMKGAVPEGWEKKSVDGFDSFSMSESKLKKFKGEKRYLATADITDIKISGEGEIITWENKPSRAQLKPELNSVFFARMSNTFKVLNFTESNIELTEELALTSGFLGLKAKNKLCFPYLFTLIKGQYFHNFKDVYANGATQVSLTNEGFRMIKLFEPKLDLVEKFGEIVYPFYDEINILMKKNKILQNTRDLLLPRLISGKLSVEKLESEQLNMAAEPIENYTN